MVESALEFLFALDNILYLSYLGGLGGGESSLLSYVLALDRAHFAPRVICGTAGAFVKELRAHNVPAEVIPFALPYFKRRIFPTLTLGFFSRLYGYLRAHHVALIHCNDLESAYYAAPVAKFLRVPVLWTCHAWWQAERGWKMAFAEKFFARILTPTQHIRECLIAANARLRERITVSPFGVDTNLFAPGSRDDTLRDELQIARDAPLVTMLARFQSVKGHSTLLDAAPLILDIFPHARFLLVGDNEFGTSDADATRDAMHERVAADVQLRAAVVFAGFRRDVPRILRASDVLVCPSAFETYGMANLEAMSCGVPVVSTNVGGPSETIVEGETGFLVPPRDVAALAARVNELLAQPALRQAMGTNGRRRVETHYALRDSVARLQGLYRAQLNSQ